MLYTHSRSSTAQNDRSETDVASIANETATDSPHDIARGTTDQCRTPEESEQQMPKRRFVLLKSQCLSLLHCSLISLSSHRDSLPLPMITCISHKTSRNRTLSPFLNQPL